MTPERFARLEELYEEMAVMPVRSKNSCSIAVILQYPAEALAAAYSASGLLLANLFRREEEDVAFPLVVSFRVKMIDEFG